MPHRFFSKDDLIAIEREVASAEARTSGEIVPLVVRASQDYAWVYWASGLLGLVLASVAAYAAHWEFLWALTPGKIIMFQAAGAVLGALAALIPTVRRVFVSESIRQEAVHRQCLANFLALGLHETRDRTGVLIFLSLFERRVEILADRGINDKIAPGYWDSQVHQIVEGIRQGQHARGLCEAIGRIGEKLAKDFPPRHDDVDEHSNSLRFGHQESKSSDQA